MIIAALFQVANTIRLAALARRREIGIMRLVGASTLYIGLPFVLESLVTAVIGVVLAAGSLWAFWWFVIENQLAKDLHITVWIGSHELLVAIVCVAILGPLLTLLPTLVLTRKYVKV